MASFASMPLPNKLNERRLTPLVAQKPPFRFPP